MHRTRYVLRGALTMRQLQAAEERNAAIPDLIFRVDRAGALLDFKPPGGNDPVLQGHGQVDGRLVDLLPEAAAEPIVAAL